MLSAVRRPAKVACFGMMVKNTVKAKATFYLDDQYEMNMKLPFTLVHSLPFPYVGATHSLLSFVHYVYSAAIKNFQVTFILLVISRYVKSPSSSEKKYELLHLIHNI